jgi:hypothetical protein
MWVNRQKEGLRLDGECLWLAELIKPYVNLLVQDAGKAIMSGDRWKGNLFEVMALDKINQALEDPARAGDPLVEMLAAIAGASPEMIWRGLLSQAQKIAATGDYKNYRKKYARGRSAVNDTSDISPKGSKRQRVLRIEAGIIKTRSTTVKV